MVCHVNRPVLMWRPANQEFSVNRPKRSTTTRNRIFFITVLVAVAVGFWMARG